MVFLRLSLFSGIITRLRMLRSIIIVFTSELSLCSNKMVLDFCWFRRVSEHMSCPFQPFASLFAIFSMTFLRSWLLVQVLGPGSLTALVKGLLAVPCRVLQLGAAIGAVGGYPRGIPFFWQIKMWETHGSYRKIVEKTWLTWHMVDFHWFSTSMLVLP